jgi:transcription antitermination factor NusG
MKWVACRTKTGSEYCIRAKIAALDSSAEVFIPRKQVKVFVKGKLQVKTERILPGYILIGSESLLDVPKLNELVKVVGRVTETEISHLRAISAQIRGILETDATFIIVEGPLQGCKGRILSKNEDKTYHCRVMFRGIELVLDLKKEFMSESG